MYVFNGFTEKANKALNDAISISGKFRPYLCRYRTPAVRFGLWR